MDDYYFGRKNKDDFDYEWFNNQIEYFNKILLQKYILHLSCLYSTYEL